MEVLGSPKISKVKQSLEILESITQKHGVFYGDCQGTMGMCGAGGTLYIIK
jgi:hypothetical protein